MAMAIEDLKHGTVSLVTMAWQHYVRHYVYRVRHSVNLDLV